MTKAEEIARKLLSGVNWHNPDLMVLQEDIAAALEQFGAEERGWSARVIESEPLPRNAADMRRIAARIREGRNA